MHAVERNLRIATIFVILSPILVLDKLGDVGEWIKKGLGTWNLMVGGRWCWPSLLAAAARKIAPEDYL